MILGYHKVARKAIDLTQISVWIDANRGSYIGGYYDTPQWVTCDMCQIGGVFYAE